MVANPDKFQSIILSRNSGVSNPLSVQNNDLRPTNEVLGVTLDDRLNFESHVDDICNHASRQINSFKCFSKYLKVHRQLSVYRGFIQSNFSYCPVAWLFCGRKNSNKLEKLQEWALHKDFKWLYIELWSSVQKGQYFASFFLLSSFFMHEMYKCIKETNPTYLNYLFNVQARDYQLRDSNRLIQSQFNTFKFGFKSFTYFGAKCFTWWYKTIAESIHFKTKITKWCHSDAAKALEENMF